MKPSLTTIFSCVFLVFILHSIWNLILLFRPPTCGLGEICYTSYLNDKPPLELLLYVTDNSRISKSELTLHVKNFDYDQSLERSINLKVSSAVRNNGSMFLHVVVLPLRRSKRELSLSEAKQYPDSTYLKGKLTRYMVPKSSTFQLLKEETKEQNLRPVTHISNKFAILMCNNELYIPHNNAPMELIRYLRINDKRQFMPIIVQDFLQTRIRDFDEVMPDTEEVKFSFIYNPATIGKFKFLIQMQDTFVSFINLGFTEKDIDEVKGVFADTNLYLLCATVFIGSVHLLLDFLSFKNDVSFWKSHKSMAGLSSRTVLWRAFSQTIIFLSLLDEGTSLLVVIPSGIGTIIEFWKVKKVLKASISWRNGLQFSKEQKESEEEAKTRQYDEESMKYLSFLLYPLCITGAIYSLIYQPHKSWYSWTISSLVNGVYVFGFLFMLPQLFVNYRLKSVAALPWRAFTYRAFNTFIDDVFAFIITMPTAHRLACFRDDLVFIIYLYQRWLYPVDKTRSDDIINDEVNSEAEEKKMK